MPISEAQLNFTAVDLFDRLPLPCEKGVLVSTSFMRHLGDSAAGWLSPAHYYAAIYLTTSDRTIPDPMILLAEGRIGSFNAVTWHGRIQMEPNSCLVALVSGFFDGIFTLRAMKEL